MLILKTASREKVKMQSVTNRSPSLDFTNPVNKAGDNNNYKNHYNNNNNNYNEAKCDLD